jgi:signal transduction histidine kinase
MSASAERRSLSKRHGARSEATSRSEDEPPQRSIPGTDQRARPLSAHPLSLHSRLRRALWAAVIGAFLAIALGVVAVGNLLDARDVLVDRLDPAALAAEQLVSALVEQEAAVRAYVLTGERSFLDPYDLGRTAQSDAVAALDRLVGRSSVGPELRQAVAAADRWSTSYTAPTLAAVRAGSTEPRLDSSVAAGRALFDRFRSDVGTLQQRLDAERNDARHDLDRATRLLVGALVAVAVLLVVIVGGLFRLIRRRVEEPLDGLLEDAKTVAGGTFEHPIRASGVAELHELGTAIEAMRARIVDELAASHDARDELGLQASELARSNDELEQFAYVASHDLQEPLRKVTAFSQLLQQRYRGQLDDRADQYIDFAVDGAKRMQVLINDLLAFSRVGREGIAAEAVDADELVDAAVANLGVLLREAGAELTRDALPRVEVVPALGTAVLQNLIANGVKFRRPDVVATVHVSGAVDGGWAELSVADNGIGIEAAYAERVFVIFQRLHTKEEYTGTGIGLALCRKIVEQHGGRIWVDTDATSDHGTVVRFTLPAAGEGDET